MDTPRSTYPTFSWTERRRLLRALEQAHDARLYRRLRAVAEIAEGEPVAVVAKHARVERSTVYRWIERYLAERAPFALADGKRSGRPSMTPALTHVVQQILARIPVAAHLATYLILLCRFCNRGKTPGGAAFFACPSSMRHDLCGRAAATVFSDLSRPELETLLVELFGKVAALEKIVGEQRAEIARLKGLKSRPAIKPSGMDQATEPVKPADQAKRRLRSKVTPRVIIEDQVIKAAAVPEGSRFKGHEPFLVQDLVISTSATCYLRERWVTPDGHTILAPLPAGIDGHFGPELRRFVLMHYYPASFILMGKASSA